MNWTSWKPWCERGGETHFSLRPVVGSALYSSGSTLCLAKYTALLSVLVGSENIERLEITVKEKGSYILIIKLPTEQTIRIGSLNVVQFSSGDYAYVGSAMRGFQSRLSHHRRQNKKPHWHVDYLLQRASINSVILCESLGRTECTIARAFSRQFDSISGFGSSDCKCRSHLFFAVEAMKPTIMTILHSLGMMPRLA